MQVQYLLNNGLWIIENDVKIDILSIDIEILGSYINIEMWKIWSLPQ